MLVFLVLFLTNGFGEIDSAHHTEDYCWRDYEGVLPADAFSAFRDLQTEPLYFGQTAHQNITIPGKLLQSRKKLFYEFYSKEYQVDQNVKIFCVKDPSRFEWIPTNNTHLLRLRNNRLLVKGGYEAGYRTYLGRINFNGTPNVGKIICRVTDCYGIYITNDGATQVIGENYEVLAHNAAPGVVKVVEVGETGREKVRETESENAREKGEKGRGNEGLVNCHNCHSVVIHLY
ncbi:hypothetical protein PPYR_09285 [Photinus pyralis]|uniref:Uncharacterized protein n=1 Tax=Photinus pyralis TaxID=7054 RepID=A0A5N4ALR6_PHOPY|nr:uncharacterized protein LOC116171950 [Photinus pyralis]KAB0798292.1 hypothetical protein PPYR_09285 [Photinus pyralis]